MTIYDPEKKVLYRKQGMMRRNFLRVHCTLYILFGRPSFCRERGEAQQRLVFIVASIQETLLFFCHTLSDCLVTHSRVQRRQDTRNPKL